MEGLRWKRYCFYYKWSDLFINSTGWIDFILFLSIILPCNIFILTCNIFLLEFNNTFSIRWASHWNPSIRFTLFISNTINSINIKSKLWLLWIYFSLFLCLGSIIKIFLKNLFLHRFSKCFSLSLLSFNINNNINFELILIFISNNIFIF